MDEWKMLMTIAEYMNGRNYDELEKFVLQHQENITAKHLRALIELPVRFETISKYKKLYKLLVEKQDTINVTLDLMSTARYIVIKTNLEESLAK